MGLEEIKDIEEKILVLQNAIQEGGNEIHFDLLFKFLERLRNHAQIGESFRSYKTQISSQSSSNITDNLRIYNKYLLDRGEKPLTKKNIKKIYNFFGKKRINKCF